MIRPSVAIPMAVVLVVACAHTVTSENRLCTPGNYVFCRCVDRGEGTKLCKKDGLGFEPCDACQGGSEDPGTNLVDASDLEDTNVDLPDEGPIPPLPDASDDAPVSTVARPAPGEVLISEVMYDPSGTEPDQEWIELYNAATSERLLSGLTLRDGGNRTHVISATPPLVIAPRAFVVLVRNKAIAIGVEVPQDSIVYEYGGGSVTQGILLGNGATGSLLLQNGTGTVASSIYGGWFTQALPGGRSIQLKDLTLAGSLQAAGWCLSSTVFGVLADQGTPGAPPNCP